ncbi:hypothetical protein ACFPIF_09945 [Brevundimonas faecalis]|uniref:hypothetical protein n=1 Tax=Brevundimonas faecalis TaxID=947378 RepID=UPI0036146A7E
MKLSLVDLRIWPLVIAAGLAASLWVSHAERGAAVARADRAEADLVTARGAIVARDADLAQARAHVTAAEARLTDFAAETARNFHEQAAASARMAAELAETNRRLRAAQLEISRADSGLRLDDPLPRGLRDGLACARGAADACPAAEADSGHVPGRAADAPGAAVAAAAGADRA